MVCKNCGATYGEEEDRCPFCLSENPMVMKKKKDNVIKHYLQQNRRIKDLPIYILKKTTKITGKSVIVILIILITLLVFTFFLTKIKVDTKQKETQSRLEQLETYYQEKQYARIREYMDEKDLYGSQYAKYYEISRSYYYYENMMDNIVWLEEILATDYGSEKEKAEFVATALYYVVHYGISAVKECESAMSDFAPLGNEDELENIRDMVKEQLISNTLLTEAEYDQILQLDKFEEEGFKPYSNAIVERIMGE